jgi:homoserine kinase type II
LSVEVKNLSADGADFADVNQARQRKITMDQSPPVWTDTDIRAFLAHYDLSDNFTAAAPLLGGCDNLNLRVDCPEKQVIIRRYSHTPAVEIEWELQVIHYLNHRHFPTPFAYVGKDGASIHDFLGKPAVLFEFVAGQEPSPNSPKDCAQMTAAIAQLHLLTRDLHLPHTRTATSERYLSELAACAQLSSPRLAEMVAHMEDFQAAFAQRLRTVGGDLPVSIVHHDPNPGNALLDEKRQLVALLDFDEAHEGPMLLDVAALLRMWATPHSWRGFEKKMVKAILTTYNAIRPLSREKWELLPDFVLYFSLADAAGYVSGRLMEDTSGTPVKDCYSYRRFLALDKDRSWVEILHL